MNYLLLILIITIITILYNKNNDRISKINSKIPGSRVIPLLLKFRGDKLHLKYQEYYEKYGPIFRVNYGAINRVVLTGYPILKEAFVDNSEHFSQRFIRDNVFIRFYSLNKFKGIVFSNGDYHKNLKSVLLSELTSTKIKKMEIHINDESKRLCELLEKHANEGKEFIMNKYFNLFSINIILRFIFGINVPYDDLNGPSVEIIDTIQRFFKLLSSPLLSDYLGFNHPFPERPREFFRCFRNLMKHIGKMIQDYKNKRVDGAGAETDNEQQQSKPIIEKLLMEVEKGNLDQLGLIVTCVDMLIAGGDTVGQTLMFSIIAMVNDKSIQDKLHHSLISTIPSNEDYSYSKYKLSIPYLSIVIKETFRKYPVGILGLPHITTEDVEIGGYTIAKGTQVIQNLYTSHRSEDFWKNPNDFIPERFLEKDAPPLHHFGVGPRSCIGQSLAECEVTSAIATLIKQFEFINPNPTQQLNDNGDFSVALVAPQTKLLVKKRSYNQ